MIWYNPKFRYILNVAAIGNAVKPVVTIFIISFCAEYQQRKGACRRLPLPQHAPPLEQTRLSQMHLFAIGRARPLKELPRLFQFPTGVSFSLHEKRSARCGPWPLSRTDLRHTPSPSYPLLLYSLWEIQGKTIKIGELSSPPISISFGFLNHNTESYTFGLRWTKKRCHC